MVIYDVKVFNGGENCNWNRFIYDTVVPYLDEIWQADYNNTFEKAKHAKDVGNTPQIVWVDDGSYHASFHYLFDITAGRLLAACGMSQGKNEEKRDSYRQAEHPCEGTHLYDRGHAIAHTLGGGLDINIVKQNRTMNRGKFRELERMSVAFPNSFYFSYWMYQDRGNQTPIYVSQGLLRPGFPAIIERFAN